MSTDTSKSLFDQAMKEILRGNFVPAEHLLQQASEINEEGTTLYAASWAVLLALRDRAEEAIAILEERLATFSTDTNLLLAYGLTLEKQGNFDDAEDAFREVLSQDATNPGALRGMSEILKRRGDKMEAAQMAVRAFTEAPDNVVFAKAAADMLEALDQTKTAFEVVDLAAHYNPEDEEMVSRALQGCLANNMIERAREILTIVDINQPWAAGWKASFLDWQGDHAAADELIERTLARPAGKDLGFLFQAACVAMRRGDVDKAEHFVESILAADPQHTGALRIRADLSLGRTDLDGAIDPLMKAFAASSDSVTGWRLFWSCILSGRLDEAEETLSTLADDEDIASDPLDAARLELATQFLDAMHGNSSEGTHFDTLDQLPEEAACGLLMEYLDAIDESKKKNAQLKAVRAALLEQLGLRDPLLRLNRLYARSDWSALAEALAELFASITSGEPILGDETNSVYRLYSFMSALAQQQQDKVEEFSSPLEGEMPLVVTNFLSGRAQRNPTEQRWLDKLTAEFRKPVAPPPPAPEPIQTTPTGVNIDTRQLSGGLIDTREIQAGRANAAPAPVVYETEDGELLTDFDESEYEVVEEVDVGNDEEYEYVWVEENE